MSKSAANEWIPSIRSERSQQTGSIEWEWRNTKPALQPLQIGAVLGAALSKVPGRDYWSLGESPFTISEDAELVFADVDSCLYFQPPAVELDLPAFTRELQACEAADSERGSERARRHNEPADTFAAHCSPAGTFLATRVQINVRHPESRV